MKDRTLSFLLLVFGPPSFNGLGFVTSFRPRFSLLWATVNAVSTFDSMERETGLEPATSSLGKQKYFVNTELLRRLRQYRPSRIKEITVFGSTGPLTH
jgi:hypothetical protein